MCIRDSPYFAQRVKERYADIDAQRTEIKADINAWAEHLSLSQAENDSIWQTIGTYVWPNPVVYDTYEEEVGHLIEWLDTRMNWLADAIDGL